MKHVPDRAPAPVFPAQWLTRFHDLALRAERAGAGPLLGRRPRRLPAGGTEATGVRDYCPGDDLRYVDWKLCARRDEVLTKTFEGTADLHVTVLLDVSESMGSGPAGKGSLGEPVGPKDRMARQVAAACGCWALKNLAVFSLVTFSGGLGPSLQGLRGRWHSVRLLRFLEQLRLQASPTDLPGSVAAFGRLPQRRGPVIVVSDLLDCRGFDRGLDMLRYYGYEPRVVQVYAPEDATPPRLGDVELIDRETGRRQRATITERAAARYRQRFGRFLEEVESYCTRRTMPRLQFQADLPEDQAMRAILGLPNPAGRSGHIA